MWEGPEFHQRPRLLVAERQAVSGTRKSTGRSRRRRRLSRERLGSPSGGRLSATYWISIWDKLWAEATIDEQREVLSIFRSITATPEGLAFEVPDLAVGFEIALQTGRSAVVEVAGPGLEPSTALPTPFPTSFSLVLV